MHAPCGRTVPHDLAQTIRAGTWRCVSRAPFVDHDMPALQSNVTRVQVPCLSRVKQFAALIQLSSHLSLPGGMSLPLRFFTLALKNVVNWERVNAKPVVGDRNRAPLEGSSESAS